MGGRIRLSVGVVRFEHMDPTEAEVPPQDVRILRTDFFFVVTLFHSSFELVFVFLSCIWEVSLLW